MKNSTLFPVAALGATLILSGCNTTESRVASNQPGPAVGRAIGTAVGAVGSNVVGVGVGMAEGAASATKSTFTNERRYVRTLLAKNDGNVSHAARDAGLSRGAFYALMKRAGIDG